MRASIKHIAIEHVGYCAQMIAQRLLRMRFQMNEDETVPAVDGEWRESVLAFFNLRKILRIRKRDEVSLVVV